MKTKVDLQNFIQHENGRMCKTLFANGDIIRQNMQASLSYI